jgi:hypothetical protein
MSNLLKALASPPFDYYPPWESKDETDASVLKQPDQIKVQYSAPVENANSKKDMVGYVAHVQDEHRWIVSTHPSATMTSCSSRCSPNVSTGVAVNIWDHVLEEQMSMALAELANKADESTLDYDRMFVTVVQHYLKEVQDVKFIGDAGIRFLQGNNRKPAAMTPAKFFRRRGTILYASSPEVTSALSFWSP